MKIMRWRFLSLVVGAMLAVSAFVPSEAFALPRAEKNIDAPSGNIGNLPSSVLAQSDLLDPVSLNLPAPDTLGGPAQVILIRHGEKPPVGNKLNDTGRARAEALVGFFKSNPAVTQHGAPAAIYAMAPSSADGSLRPIETVTPLAQSLGLGIVKDYTKKEGVQLAKAVMSDANCAGKTALICWEHKAIPDLLKDFGWTSGPTSWPGRDIFDRAWILNFENGKPVSFQDVPEHLLPGDSAN